MTITFECVREKQEREKVKIERLNKWEIESKEIQSSLADQFLYISNFIGHYDT